MRYFSKSGALLLSGCYFPTNAGETNASGLWKHAPRVVPEDKSRYRLTDSQ